MPRGPQPQPITLTAEPRILADYDTALPGWGIIGGSYKIALARNAADRATVMTARMDAATMKP